jgi:serine/threonine protein kinase
MAVAVKKIKLPPSSSNFEAFEHRVSCVLRDIEVMHHGPLAQHDNILRLWGYGWDNEQGDTIPYLVTELAQEGTLREYLRNSRVPIINRLGLCGQIIAGLYEMHLCGVAHGDLKLDNVLAVETELGSPITAKIVRAAEVLWCYNGSRISFRSQILGIPLCYRQTKLP